MCIYSNNLNVVADRLSMMYFPVIVAKEAVEVVVFALCYRTAWNLLLLVATATAKWKMQNIAVIISRVRLLVVVCRCFICSFACCMPTQEFGSAYSVLNIFQSPTGWHRFQFIQYVFLLMYISMYGCVIFFTFYRFQKYLTIVLHSKLWVTSLYVACFDAAFSKEHVDMFLHTYLCTCVLVDVCMFVYSCYLYNRKDFYRDMNIFLKLFFLDLA